jgi:hypothetical protein
VELIRLLLFLSPGKNSLVCFLERKNKRGRVRPSMSRKVRSHVVGGTMMAVLTPYHALKPSGPYQYENGKRTLKIYYQQLAFVF